MVLLASIPGSVSDGLPISSLDLPPRASLPWQSEQPLSSNSFAPCAAVPLPGGSPVPSGRMVTSQALMSASVTGLPRFGVLAANAAEEARVMTSAVEEARRLSVDMFDLPVGADGPGGEAVV